MQAAGKTIAQRIERARELLAEIPHVAIATVNKDGSPHNSPVFMAFDDQLNGFWSSSPESLHSQNIRRGSQVFLVVFDSREGHGGLFVEAQARMLEAADEIEHGHRTLAARKEDFVGQLGRMGELKNYSGAGPQRIYQAVSVRFWVNVSDHDEVGTILRDHRYEIRCTDLISE